jgi:PBP1b-binding outer membrane lipoprotein LpoB
MKRKFISTLVFELLSILFITGCSSNQQTAESENKSKNTSDFPIESIEKEFDQDEFKKKYPDYHIDFDKESGMESISITNHDPKDIVNLPNYQELVQYGYISLESDDIVYAIDIFIDDTGSFYSAEYDAKTKELLTEEGDWTPEGELAEFVAERLEMMDFVLQ